MSTKPSYRAAWVPARPDTTWTADVELAVPWVEAHAVELGVPGLLYVNALHGGPPDALDRFGARHSIESPRSSRGHGPSAVLAYVPTIGTIVNALSRARNGAVCIVEGFTEGVAGWAMEVGARNLVTGEVAADTRSDAVRKGLEMVQFIGNNGWGDDHARRLLRTTLPQLHAELDAACWTMVVGYALAHGSYEGGIKNLTEELEKAGCSEPPRGIDG